MSPYQIYTGADCPTSKILRSSVILVLLFILPLVTCPLWGQVVQKKQLTPEDYHLWSQLLIDRVSPSEEWTSYKLSYPRGVDTLFIRNKNTLKTYHYPSGNHSLFTKNNHFVCMSKNALQILNLKTGNTETIDSVITYEYSKKNDRLLILKKSLQQLKDLSVKIPSGKTLRTINNVNQFSLSPDGQHLLYNTTEGKKEDLFLLKIENLKNDNCILKQTPANLYDFVWQKEGKAVAFYSKSLADSRNTLYYYILETDQMYHLDLAGKDGFQPSTDMISRSAAQLKISDDLQTIFFGITIPNTTHKNSSIVEIWNSNDKLIFPQQNSNTKFYLRLAAWKPFKNICMPLTTEDLPKIFLTGDQRYAILSNPLQYEPQFDYEAPRDYYLVNLDTFEKKLFLKEHYGNVTSIVTSPTGKYIAYFKGDCWWIYTISSDTHHNMTKGMGINFKGKHDSLSPDILSGSPGWSSLDKELLIYDKYDIWAVSAENGSAKKLTHGREHKIIFRIAPLPNVIEAKGLYNGRVTNTYDLQRGLYLKATGDDGKSGVFKWTLKTAEKKIVYKDSYIDQIFYGEKNKGIVFSEERFDLPPRISLIDNKTSGKIIFQSNPQQKKYYCGRSELIQYENSKKETLKAILVYPAQYDPMKKYPMIVKIYEKQSQDIHLYHCPSRETGDGFNPAVYSVNGYFVLLPDIVHEHQNVGGSTTDCVVSATRKIISMGILEPKRIGIIGHSYGGYESSFIITQTNLFAAAVSGGSINDLTSFYLTINKSSQRPEMWRFQDGQWRMGKTPFEATSLYERNSPISHVQNISTPILLWSGKQDGQVDPQQSIEFYLALRRLDKKSILLFYPNQDHVIQNSEQHIDLSNRIQNWFDYFLKDIKTSRWISQGLN